MIQSFITKTKNLFQVNTDYVVKSTEAFRQWEYRSENGNGKGKKRRGDEARIIDLDDDDDDEDEDDDEDSGTPVIEESTCPFGNSNEEEEVRETSGFQVSKSTQYISYKLLWKVKNIYSVW